MNDIFEKCPLCKRQVYERDMVYHHWIPKSTLKKENIKDKNHYTLRICDTCHKFLHYVIPIEEICHYNSIELLQNCEQMKAYLQYIQTIRHPHRLKLKKLIEKLR